MKRIKKSLIIAFLVLLSQLIYSRIFGKENALVGMIMAMASANFLSQDFASRIYNKTTTFIVLNIGIGIISYVACINIYIGLVLNLATIFLITYIYIDDFKVPTSYIFLMCYIFLIFTPIELEYLPRRIISLLVGILLIVIPQYILNRKSFLKKYNNVFLDTCREIEYEIENLEHGRYKTQINIDINEKLRKILIELNHKSYKKYYSTVQSKIIFNIAVSLERINIIIFNLSKEKHILDSNFLKDLKAEMNLLIRLFEDEDLFDEINKKIYTMENKYKTIEYDYINESIMLLQILKSNIEKLKKLDYKNFNKINKHNRVPNEFKKIVRARQNFNFDSVLFVYSLKLALVISISIFLVKYLDLVYGKWIVITIYVLMQLYKEDTKIKVKKRFKGSSVGVLIFLLTFSIVKDSVPKVIIMYIAFFFYFYCEDYYQKVVSMTIISLASISFLDNINILSIDRLMSVLIGIVIVVLFDKFVFPYSIEDSIKDLKRKYIRLARIIKNEINKDYIEQDKMIKLVLLCGEIENKLMINNLRTENKNLEVFIIKSKLLLSDIRYLIIKQYYIDKDYMKNKELNKNIIISLTNKVNIVINSMSKYQNW